MAAVVAKWQRIDVVVDNAAMMTHQPITEQYYQRYNLSVIHTETNSKQPGAVAWME